MLARIGSAAQVVAERSAESVPDSYLGLHFPATDLPQVKPETRTTKPETRNPKPETRNPKPETRNPKP